MTRTPDNAIGGIFGRNRALIGMVHVRALPGTPNFERGMDEITAIAVAEATILMKAGFDGVLIENMHDVPYLRGEVGPEIVAGMTRVGAAIRDALPDAPMGIQILAGANIASMAVAHAAGAQFIRAENFVFSHVADEGHMPEASAGPLLRYRRSIGAESIQVFADIRKKHAAHALTADLSMGQWASGAEFAGAGAVIVTGGATGETTALSDLREATRGASLPVLAGSGATADNVPEILGVADGVIVGSALKAGGHWANEIDRESAARFVAAANTVR